MKKLTKHGLAVRISLVLMTTGFLVFQSYRGTAECEQKYTLEDVSKLTQIAVSYMKSRPGELSALGFRSDGADLEFAVTSVSSRDPLPDAEVDHPMDRATIFLYATINEYGYRFAFGACGNILSRSNLTGFDLSLESKRNRSLAFHG